MKKAVKAKGGGGKASRGRSSTSGTKPQPKAAASRKGGQTRFSESASDAAQSGF